MKKRSYKEAYELIIQAYFKDGIRPFLPTFCFCGTLAGTDSWYNNGSWFYENEPNYTYQEFKRMEKPLLDTICMRIDGKPWGSSGSIAMNAIGSPLYEDALFEGMCKALEVLKQIHIERGENVEENDNVFHKRTIKNDERTAVTEA